MGGVSHETLATGESTGASIGLRRDGNRWAYGYAGIPFDTSGVSWAAVGAGMRAETARLRVPLGIDVRGQAHGYRQQSEASGTGATGEAFPFVRLAMGATRLELHTGARVYTTSFEDSSFTRWVRSHGATAELELGGRAVAFGEAEVVEADDGVFPYLGGATSYSRGPISAWGSIGKWFSDENSTLGWSVGVGLVPGGRFQADIEYTQDATDPLYWNLPRRSWRITVSRDLSRRRGGAEALFPVTVDGRVRVTLPVSESRDAPFLAGDFTNWEPVAMSRSGDEWVASFPIASGVYRYAFRRSDGSWFVPESVAERVSDGFGGYSAVLIVP